jgi:iron complex outermembrane receptor protein
MPSYRSFSVTLFCVSGLVYGQSAPASADSEHEKIVNLDSVIVTAGADGKTAFDLAQGTSILAGDNLRLRSQSTLGETLASTPGVTSTYYGPGASRPLIRGLGGDRVRVLADGVGALDVSAISPDHNVPIEPLFASRIEVLRGPSTLLYGSSAVGGVVNVIDNRIPDAAGDGRLHGALEARGWGAANERAGVLAVGVGQKTVGLQIDALRLKTDDVKIPGVARIDADAPLDQPSGTLPNSAIDTKDGSIGASGFWSGGHAGAAVHQYETAYGVPTGEEPPVRINLKQTRYDLAGDVTRPFGFFRSAKLRFGYARYRHSELDGDDVATSFENNAWEGRVELPHEALGPVTGTIGVQAAHSNFAVGGAEVVAPPSHSTTGGVFALEELKSGGVTYNGGARLETQSLRLGEVPLSLPAFPGYAARTGQKKEFTAGSASFGAVWYPKDGYAVGASLAYSERIPTTQELYSNGPHGGTGTYEVGTSNLEKEKSVGFDLNVRRRAGFVTGTISAFVNRFSGYLFEQQLPGDAIPTINNPDGLTPYQFVSKDALFYGGELEASLHLMEQTERSLHLDITSDYVHAEQTTDDQPLPRMPPWRWGARLRYDDTHWHGGLETRRTEPQNRFTQLETATPGNTAVNANLSYVLTAGTLGYELFVRGENLTNAKARSATSFLKDFAPLPGRGVTAGIRLTF